MRTTPKGLQKFSRVLLAPGAGPRQIPAGPEDSFRVILYMSHRVNSTEALPRFLRKGGVSDWAPDSWQMTKEGFSGHESEPAQSRVSLNPSILAQEEL